MHHSNLFGKGLSCEATKTYKGTMEAKGKNTNTLKTVFRDSCAYSISFG